MVVVRLAAAFLGSMPVNGLPVVLLLLFVTSTDVVTAALLLGVHTGANALGLVVQGRLMARFGHFRVLVSAGAVHGVTLVLLPTASGGVLVVACAVAGLSFPELNTSLRALAIQAGDRSTLSLSAASFEVASVMGPLLGSWASLGFGAAAAVRVTAVWTFCATCVYLVGLVGVSPRNTPPSSVSGRQVGVGSLIVLHAVPAGCFSILAVTATLVAATTHAPVLAGALRATLSVGALLGAVWMWARRSSRKTMPVSFALLVGVSVVAALSDNVVVLVVCLLVGGTALTPITVLANMLVPKDKAVSTVGLLQGTAVLAGGGFTAVTGWFFAAGGPSFAFMSSAAVAAAGLAVAWKSVRRGNHVVGTST